MTSELSNLSINSPYEKIIDAHELSVQRINFRLFVKDSDNSAECAPIIGYAEESILPLLDTCVPLIGIVHDILAYASIALECTSNEPADYLTRDESASIRLYTMEWSNSRESLYSNLNRTLKKVDREELRPWFKYLKLFLTALVKIPCNPSQTVWRGVKKNKSAEFSKGAQVTWWACSSTTTSLHVLESDLYLGTTGERTLFSIEILNGRSIRAHSHYDSEEEILLLPGTLMEVRSQFDAAPGLHIIHLKQIEPNELLLEPPFNDACLYPKIPSRRWYTNKWFLTATSILVIAIITGTILGSILGFKHITKATDVIINWNGNWAYSCDFNDNDLQNVTSLSSECGPICSQTPHCTHFMWIPSNGGTCFMKKGNVSKNDAFLTSDSTFICGVNYDSHCQGENATVSWNGNNWAYSCNFDSNDLSNVVVPPYLCVQKCAETNGCTHYVWSREGVGITCWMKYGNVSKDDACPTTDPSMLCGVMNGSQYDAPNSTVSWNESHWAVSCDFINNDLSNSAATSPGLCGELCTERQNCTHFTWTNLNDGTCWMKYGNVSKNDAFFINDPTTICGMKSST